jgi:hypothetical protein
MSSILSTETSAIKQTVADRNQQAAPVVTENWVKFFWGILITIAVVILVGILGANFVYIIKNNLTLILNKQTDYTSGFPYSMIGVSGGIPSSFASTCKDSFMKSRSFLTQYLNKLESINESIPFLLASFNLGIGTTLAYLVGLVTSVMGLKSSMNLAWFIFFWFFGYNWFMMFSLSTIQMLLFFITFAFVPLFKDFKETIKIIGNHFSLLVALFGVGFCITSFVCLDVTTSIIFTLYFLGSTIYNYKK